MIQTEEIILYEILKCLAQSDLPIIFKGALLTKLLVKDSKYNIERMTYDIDADWNGDLLTLEQLELKLNNIITSKLNNIKLKSFRNYGEGKSAGFDILQNEKKIASFDLDMRKNKYYKLYEIDGINFYGSSIDKIYSDKIYVLSTNLIFRRTKDLIDLLLLTSVSDINVDEVNRISNEKNKPIDCFDALYNRKDEIEHAYNLLNRVKNKPPFEDIYSCCINISKLFIK